MLSAGVIVESHSPWRDLTVVVKTPNGKLRLTINYKIVNKCTIFDAFPLDRIEDIVQNLSSARYFSSIDFSQCYHQLPLLPSDQEKTAFAANGKLYQYTRCPFGLTNAVAYCSRVMKTLFGDIEGVATYLDDVLVYGSNKESHDKILQTVLNRIKKSGENIWAISGEF